MSINCFQRLSFLLVLLALTVPALQLDWQASGNMTESNLTEIRTNIDTFTITPSHTIAQINQISRNISLRLNQIWDPAWNVVITTTLQKADTILYGYAYKNHWFWINSIPIQGRNTVCAYVIWKDFNCNRWRMVNQLGTQTFTFGQAIAIFGNDFSAVATDVWVAAFNFVEHINRQTGLSSGGYSVVMSQHSNANFHGHICLVDGKHYLRTSIVRVKDITYGSYLMFQTRQQ